MTSTRPRPSSTLPKAPTTLSPTAIIDTSCTLTGTYPITIASSAILHPRARIISSYSPITVGPDCIIHSRATIGLRVPPEQFSSDEHSAQIQTHGVQLAANVVVENGAAVAAASVGEDCVIGAGARVGPRAMLGKGCKVGARCEVAEGEILVEGTVVWGRKPGERRVGGIGGLGGEEAGRIEELRRAAHGKQVEGLRRLIKSDLAKFGGPVGGEATAAE